MNLAANAYAISPSLHDWEREEWEEQEIERDREEERFNADFLDWQRFAYCDRDKPKDKAQIIDYVEDALDMIASDEKSRKQFNALLFNAYCSDFHCHRNNLMEMVGSYLKTAYRKKCKREEAA